MVVTMLEARVAEDRLDDLQSAYEEIAKELPPDILETFLVRDSDDATMCRILTVWASREALDRMRASVEKPGGVLVFEAAGATPTLTVLDVVVHRHRG